jgi:hypothetical protein
MVVSASSIVTGQHLLLATGPESHFNPFGIAALGVGLIVLIILLITFRRR